MLEDYMNNRPKPQQEDLKTPRGWDAHTEVGNEGLEIVTKAVAVKEGDFSEATPDDCRRILQENKLNPDAWTLVSYRRSHWQQKPDVWLEATKLSAKPSGNQFGVAQPNLDSVVSSMKRVKRKALPQNVESGTTLLGLLADAQVGKTERGGGTPELLERQQASLDAWFTQIKKFRPEEIWVVDPGDPIENEHNTTAQVYENDLSLPDQLSVWSQIFWEWIEVAAANAPKVKVISVPSNHGALRIGIGDKGATGKASNDWGIFIHSQLKRQARLMPDKYGHVEFLAPEDYYESINVETIGGHNIGVVHGHQVSRPYQIDDWWAKQSAGRGPTANSETLIHGHFHSTNIRQGIGGKWIFGAPTMDGGSSWYFNKSGQKSDPAVLSFIADANGPRDWAIC